MLGPAQPQYVHCSTVSVQVQWQSRGSPVMITERTKSNRNEMEQNGTNPKALELTETLYLIYWKITTNYWKI